MLSRQANLLMFELLAKKKFTRDGQKISNTKHFYTLMRNLKLNGFVESARVDGHTIFYLTERGQMRMHILGRDSDTPEKYKKYIRGVYAVVI